MGPRLFGLALVLGFVLVGCSGRTTPSSTDSELSRQVAELKSENDRLRAQVDSLIRERDALKPEAKVTPGELRVSAEQALAMVKARYPNVEVTHIRKVEFMLRKPNSWVAVWVMDCGEGPNQSSVIVDALTGDELNFTSPHSGQ